LLVKQFAIIGTGVVGTALAVLLKSKGLNCVGVNTRSRKSYDRFCHYLPNTPHLDLEKIAAEAELIFITTQDDAIESVAGQLSRLGIQKEKQFWIHCSGSLPSTIMCLEESLPVGYLSIHPLRAFATIEGAVKTMEGTHFGLEGNSEESRDLGRQLIEILGGIPHLIDPAKKNVYHAGAVVASNYLVSLAFLAVKLLESAGIGQREALEALLPLMAGSYQNIVDVGLYEALTGPIARGDSEVIAQHLQEIPPDFKETYKGLGRLALELAQQKKLGQGLSYDPVILQKLNSLLSQ